MNENDKYAPTGKTMRRIGDTVRFVETGGKLPTGSMKKRHRLIPHEEGVLLDDLLGTDDPNVPTTARFQIKSPHATGNGWSDDVSPSIVTVLNRTPVSFSALTPGFAKELHTDKWYFYTTGAADGSHHIWFFIDQAFCNDDGSKSLTVTVFLYTGTCDQQVPGENSYGQVNVEDPCAILRYYTQDFLQSGSVVGRATYMYPRGSGYCTPEWYLDTICNMPECA